MKNHACHPIRLQLDTPHQLFNSLDPSPFVARDLDREAESYIVGWANEYPRTGNFCLEITFRSPISSRDRERLEQAIHNYFKERERVCAQELRQLFAEGRFAMLVGLGFLTLCTLTGQLLEEHMPYRGAEILSEGLLVGGWVAMWKPMEIFLYRWWPIAGQKKMYKRLATMAVEIIEPETTPPEG